MRTIEEIKKDLVQQTYDHDFSVKMGSVRVAIEYKINIVLLEQELVQAQAREKHE